MNQPVLSDKDVTLGFFKPPFRGWKRQVQETSTHPKKPVWISWLCQMRMLTLQGLFVVFGFALKKNTPKTPSSSPGCCILKAQFTFYSLTCWGFWVGLFCRCFTWKAEILAAFDLPLFPSTKSNGYVVPRDTRYKEFGFVMFFFKSAFYSHCSQAH